MKKLLAFVLTLVMIVSAVTLGAFALDVSAEETIEGYYTYSVSNGMAAITDVDYKINGDVTIPDTLGGYPVTSIGDYAFAYCFRLTSITIPDSVISIGDAPFYDCENLTSINVNEGNKYYCDIDGVLFNKYATTIHMYPACKANKEYTIPCGVTSIGDRAFSNCDGLTSISIPNSVTSIGDDAFSGCISLTSISIPDSVTSIGDGAFSNCDGLTSISIPDSVTSIGNYAFSSCDSLTSIRIGNNVTSIRLSAFSGCISLTSISIPDSVTSIGDCAFYYCTGLTSISISDSVTIIGYEAFYNCTSLTDVYYRGNETDKEKIVIGHLNGYLTKAVWHYNSCINAETHTYDDETDMICNICGSKKTPYVIGDLSGDEKINNKDLALLMQKLNGWDVAINVDAADVNADGNVNNKDYALLMQYCNGWDVELK